MFAACIVTLSIAGDPRLWRFVALKELIAAGGAWWFWFAIEVDRDGVEVRYPLRKQRLGWDEILDVTLSLEQEEPPRQERYVVLHRRGRKPLRVRDVQGGTPALYEVVRAARPAASPVGQ